MGKFEKDAKDLLAFVGGKSNIKAVSHCVTRMRFVLVDDQKADVRKIENILFVNDSKATNPDSTAKALATFVGYKIFWLVGGRSKKIDPLRYVSKYLKNVHKIYLFGESENEFAEIFKKSAKTVCCKDLEIAVNTAFKEAQKETGPIVVLLSPMCASFDQFKNFEERGDKFVEIVLKLRKDEKQF